MSHAHWLCWFRWLGAQEESRTGHTYGAGSMGPAYTAAGGRMSRALAAPLVWLPCLYGGMDGG